MDVVFGGQAFKLKIRCLRGNRGALGASRYVVPPNCEGLIPADQQGGPFSFCSDQLPGGRCEGRHFVSLNHFATLALNLKVQCGADRREKNGRRF
ncbi:MAG: hypothetical protein COZ09_00135 [Comamonadaceae bacterium CG_4_10_14_3_um_filter_60_42]|nr:MAG: hypothetical protein COZ09_00135 [Comamonadaceae bacterium CG_4_10_14_3_um_filter_60_42]